MPVRAQKAEQLLRSARLVIPAGFLLVLVAVIGVALGLVRSRQADMLVLHTLQVQQSAETLLIDIRDAETSKRSFLLTSAPDYMEAFLDAMQAIPQELAELRALTIDNPDQRSRVGELAKLVDAKLDEFNRTHALIKAGQPDAALVILNSPESRKLITDIRTNISDVLNAETILLTERQASAARERYLRAGLIAFALVIATLLSTILAFSTLRAMKGLVDRTHELEAESKLRQEAEATLRQSQKMEAVGQLTGGIAHDFNNLLTIIIGNLDTMRRQLENLPNTATELAGKLTKPVQSAMKGADSAAQLTQRLLAYSRRQALEPARLDLNRLVSGMLEMLRRAIGEDISIETVLGAGLWPTFVDAHQVESVLLNLALNAKAAMPKGGHLTVETANCYLDDAYVDRFGDIAAGQYVLLCVTDTGTGIKSDVLDRVFEPFFTTKPRGEGSGLGLAMVHGFVKQSGGHVRIYSEEDHGTTVKIYLPRATGDEKLVAVPTGKRARARAHSKSEDGRDSPAGRGQ